MDDFVRLTIIERANLLAGPHSFSQIWLPAQKISSTTLMLFITTFDWEFRSKTVKVVATEREGQCGQRLWLTKEENREQWTRRADDAAAAPGGWKKSQLPIYDVLMLYVNQWNWTLSRGITRRNLIIIWWWSCSRAATVNERSAHRFSLPTQQIWYLNAFALGGTQLAQLNWSGRSPPDSSEQSPRAREKPRSSRAKSTEHSY